MSELHQWCDRHWQPYTSKPGGIAATLMMMQRLLEQPEFISKAGGETERINAAMA